MTPFSIIRGERAGRQGRIGVGCAGAIFDPTGEKLLLVRRADNGRWCVPGGFMEAGESVAECCEREVLEETGLEVRVTRLIGVYGDPNLLFAYADGNRWQVVHLYFAAERTGGALRTSDETTEVGFCSREEIERLDVAGFDRRRVEDAFARQMEAFVRDHIDLDS
jgi:ADP-ribose pyrophosphatase YjhB (NUDIX family)